MAEFQRTHDTAFADPERFLGQYRHSLNSDATSPWYRRCYSAILACRSSLQGVRNAASIHRVFMGLTACPQHTYSALGNFSHPSPDGAFAAAKLAASNPLQDRFEEMAKGTFGERLKRERELREVPLDEIAAATRIAPKFLEALENEKWDRLPGGVFGRGFVRSIARYLGLNEEDLLAEYDLARGETAASVEPKAGERIPSPPKWIPVVAVLVLLALIAGLIIGGRYAWRAYMAHRAAKKTSAIVNAPPAPQNRLLTNAAINSAHSPAAPDVVSPSSSEPLELTVAVSPSTMVRVASDGTIAHHRARPGPDTSSFCAREFEVTAADSSAVLLELNGHEVPPLGLPGSSSTISLTVKDLRPSNGAVTQP